MFGRNNQQVGFGRPNRETYVFRMPAHIYFSKPDIPESKKLAGVFSKPKHEKKIYLLNPAYNFDAFNFMDRTFTINTQNGSYKFNKDLLADTSPKIRGILDESPSNLEYQLKTADEVNIMAKIEKMYQRELIKIDDSELYTFKLISEELDISNSLKNIRKNISIGQGNGLNRVNQNTNIDNSLEMMDDHLYSYFKNTMPKTFTIATKSNEYQCNIIGINSSKVLHELLSKDPTLTRYDYDFDDDCNEFQPICDFFNFNIVPLTADNMNSIRTIAEELQIDFILPDVTNYIEDFEKRIQTIDDQQSIIDSIDELFETLYKIKEITVESARNKIIESNWSKTEENVQELAAFILQVIKTEIWLHPYIADLLESLNKEADDTNKLIILVPFIIQKLMQLITESSLISSFVILMNKKGFIKKEEIKEELNKYVIQKRPTGSFGSRSSRLSESLMIFLPELYEIKESDVDQLINCFFSNYQKFIQSYIPDKIDKFIEMREKLEPDDPLTKALREDDIDTFQSIVSKSDAPLTDGVVPYNIFEEYVPNGTTNYINYSAAYGSLKCFKYLILAHVPVNDETFTFAIFGGHAEIIKIVDQKLSENGPELNQNIPKPGFGFKKPGLGGSLFNSRLRKNSPYDKINHAIRKHKNDLFDWVLEQKYPDFIQKRDLILNILTIASLNGDFHSITTIVDKGFDFSTLDRKQCTEIIRNASENGFYQLLRFISLILKDNIEQYSESNPAIFDSQSSVEFGNISIFEFYLEKSNRIDINLALSTAITRNYRNIVKYIIEQLEKEKKTNINYQIQLGNSILSKTDDIFNFLLENFEKNDPNPVPSMNLISLLSDACRSKKVEIGKKIVELILKYKKEGDNPDFSLPFYNAAVSGSTELCQIFVDQKVYIDYKLVSLQVHELAAINKDTLELIVKNMPPKAKDTFTACYLEEAIRVQNKSFIEYLLNEKAFYDESLFDAVKTNDIDIVNLILNYHSDPAFINQISTSGTALNIAVTMNNLPIVKRLLSIPEIDPSLYEVSNETPLITAITTLNIDIINAILDFYGENIKSQSWQLDDAVKKFLNILSSEKRRKERPIKKPGFSVFGKGTAGLSFSQRLLAKKSLINNDQLNDDSKFLAVLNRFLEIENIDLNCHSDNYTLFTYACEANEIDVVEIMLENPKVDVNSYAPTNGNTPLLIAIDKQNIEIVKLLIECERTNINQRNYEKETALTMAVRKNLLEIIDLIINNKKFDPIESRLDFAFYESDGEVAKKLVNIKGLDVNYKLIRHDNRKKEGGLFGKAGGFGARPAGAVAGGFGARPAGAAGAVAGGFGARPAGAAGAVAGGFGARPAGAAGAVAGGLGARPAGAAGAAGGGFGARPAGAVAGGFGARPTGAVTGGLGARPTGFIGKSFTFGRFNSSSSALRFQCTNELELFSTTLINAVQNSKIELVDLVIHHPSFDPEKSLAKEAVFFACSSNNAEIFKTLMQLYENDLSRIDEPNRTLIQIAIQSGSGNVLDLILKNESLDLTKYNLIDLFVSAFNRVDPSYDIMNTLIEFDKNHDKIIDFNCNLSNGRNFFTSIIRNTEDISHLIDYLIEHGADPNIPDELGNYPLIYAIQIKSSEYVHALINSEKIDFTKRLETKSNPENDQIEATDKTYLHLIMTIQFSSFECDILRTFINSNLMDINATDSNGETPLMIACRYFNRRAISTLFFDDGLDYQKRNNKGDDAIKICMKITGRKIEAHTDTKQNYLQSLLGCIKGQSLNSLKISREGSEDQENEDSEDEDNDEDNQDDDGSKAKTGKIIKSEKENEDKKDDVKADESKEKLDNQNEKGDKKNAFASTTANKFGGQSKFGASKFGNQSSANEKPAFGAGSFGQSKFGASKFGNQSSGDEKPTFATSKFGQSKFGANKLGDQTSGDEKPTLGTSKFGQSKFGANKLGDQSSGDEKPTFATSKFGQSKFGANKLGDQSSGDEKPTFGTSKFGQSKFGAAKLSSQSSGDEKPSLFARNLGSKASDDKPQISTRSPSGHESPLQSEISAAIRDSLEGATPEQVEKITASLSSIFDRHAREISSSAPPQKPSKEADEEETKPPKQFQFSERPNEEVKSQKPSKEADEEEAKPPKQFQFSERPNEEVKKKIRSRFELDDRYDMYDDQNQFNFGRPSYESQMFQQQWNQMMQLGNMRNAQFSMLMQQQEQMMMSLSGGSKRRQSSVRQHSNKSQKKKSRK